MKKLFILLAMITFITTLNGMALSQPVAQTSTEQRSPSASDVFGKFAAAIGGRNAAEKIKSRTARGSAEFLAMNLKGTFEMTGKAPNKSLTVLNLTGYGEVVNGFDGTIGWVNDPVQGLRNKSGAELERVRLTSDFYSDLNLDKAYPKAEVTGIYKIGTVEVYVVKADADTTLYFDCGTGLLVRSDRVNAAPGGEKGSAQISYEDYRDVDGVKRAHTIKQSMHGGEMVFKVTEIKQNIEINDTRFAKPKQ